MHVCFKHQWFTSEAAEKKLKEEVKEGKIETVECDLQDFSSVRNAAEQVLKIVGDRGT